MAAFVAMAEAVVAFSQAEWQRVQKSKRAHNDRFMLSAQDGEASLDYLSPEASKNYFEDEAGNVHIPTSGISVSDEMEAAQRDRFVTEVVPVKGLSGVAQLVTTATLSGSFEPVRYLVALSPPKNANSETEHGLEEQVSTNARTEYVMIDIPPFSPQLATRVKTYMGLNGRLLSILVTNRDAIHYDEAPAVFSTRRADLDLWLSAFSGLKIVAYRLDIPRDCRHAVSQILDGYGPFALQESADCDNFNFVESGRPLTYAKWNHDVAQDVLNGKSPPDDIISPATSQDDGDAIYTPQAIRGREEGKRVLAVYTPGYSFGSVSYVFPETGVCCSGFTIPVEDARVEENLGIGSTGPALDCRGYIASSKARKRQMESGKALVSTYGDRFDVVLPSRGDPLFLDGEVGKRKEILLDTIKQYERVGEIYEQLGIFSDENDD